MRNCQRRGFTLLEVVVVLAVMVILAVLLLSHFAYSREKARRSSCLSNLKQVALGYSQYCRDYDETYPLAKRGDAYAKANTWVDALQPYLKSRSIFMCPGDKRLNGPEMMSYGYNANLNKKSMSIIHVSEAIILNYEVQGSPIANCGFTKAAVTAPKRHLEGASYSFADCHVKWLRPENVSSSARDSSTPSFKVR